MADIWKTFRRSSPRRCSGDCPHAVIYPGNDKTVNGNQYELAYKDWLGLPVEGGETAKWCAFSFVAKSRSLAIGQIDMDGVFRKNTNLETILLKKEEKTKKLDHGFTERHYGHSYQFRSNIGFTWKLWDEITQAIKK